MRRLPIWLVISLLALSACEFSFSTAKVNEAYIASDEDGNNRATSFSQDVGTLYAMVEVGNAPDDTTTTAIWYAVEVQGEEPNVKLDEVELTGGGRLIFSLTNEQLYPLGKYKVEIYLNDKLDRTLEFEITP